MVGTKTDGRAVNPMNLPRLKTLYRRISEAPYRGVYGLTFWVVVVLTYVPGVALQDEYRARAIPITLTCVALVAVYLLLPWDRPIRKREVAALVAFAPLMVLFDKLLDGGQVFEALVVVHAVYLFGLRGGLLYTAALAPLVFAGSLFISENFGAWGALENTFYTTLLLLFTSAISTAAIKSGKRHEQTRSLLAELETAHSDLERSNTELAQRAAQVKELTLSEERARMAREMHDTVGHYLTVVNLQLGNARASELEEPEESENAWEKVDEAKALVLEALSEVRRSVRAMRPLALQEKAGAGALTVLADSFDGTGLGVSFAVLGEERELPGGVTLVLYRAMQEGLTNAAKHAGARQVHATLSFEAGCVKLVVADDGSGISGNARDARELMERGFGLSGLTERVEALGGALRTGECAGTGEDAREGYKGGFVLEVELPAGSEAG